MDYWHKFRIYIKSVVTIEPRGKSVNNGIRKIGAWFLNQSLICLIACFLSLIKAKTYRHASIKIEF